MLYIIEKDNKEILRTTLRKYPQDLFNEGQKSINFYFESCLRECNIEHWEFKHALKLQNKYKENLKNEINSYNMPTKKGDQVVLQWQFLDKESGEMSYNSYTLTIIKD